MTVEKMERAVAISSRIKELKKIEAWIYEKRHIYIGASNTQLSSEAIISSDNMRNSILLGCGKEIKELQEEFEQL